MYHHFAGKADLAAAALRRSARELREQAETALGGPGGARARIAAYLLRERDALRGCRMGRMAQDPEVVASPELGAPVRETFAWLTARLAEVLEEGRASGELPAALDPGDTAAALAAVVQGGYVLARAEGGPEPFERAARGALALLTAHAAPAAR
jgi:AcrR family transcriptional regulator